METPLSYFNIIHFKENASQLYKIIFKIPLNSDDYYHCILTSKNNPPYADPQYPTVSFGDYVICNHKHLCP